MTYDLFPPGRTRRITKADMPTDQEPHDPQSQPQLPKEKEDTFSLVDFLDSVDRTAFRRAIEHRFNYYPLRRAD